MHAYYHSSRTRLLIYISGLRCAFTGPLVLWYLFYADGNLVGTYLTAPQYLSASLVSHFNGGTAAVRTRLAIKRLRVRYDCHVGGQCSP